MFLREAEPVISARQTMRSAGVSILRHADCVLSSSRVFLLVLPAVPVHPPSCVCPPLSLSLSLFVSRMKARNLKSVYAAHGTPGLRSAFKVAKCRRHITRLRLSVSMCVHLVCMSERPVKDKPRVARNTNHLYDPFTSEYRLREPRARTHTHARAPGEKVRSLNSLVTPTVMRRRWRGRGMGR